MSRLIVNAAASVPSTSASNTPEYVSRSTQTSPVFEQPAPSRPYLAPLVLGLPPPRTPAIAHPNDPLAMRQDILNRVLHYYPHATTAQKYSFSNALGVHLQALNIAELHTLYNAVHVGTLAPMQAPLPMDVAFWIFIGALPMGKQFQYWEGLSQLSRRFPDINPFAYFSAQDVAAVIGHINALLIPPFSLSGDDKRLLLRNAVLKAALHLYAQFPLETDRALITEILQAFLEARDGLYGCLGGAAETAGARATISLQCLIGTCLSMPEYTLRTQDIRLALKLESDRYNFFKMPDFMRHYVFAGVKFDYDFSATKDANGSKNGNLELTYPKLLNAADYGYEFGLGLSFYFPYATVSPEIKFSYGQRDMIYSHNSPQTKLLNSLDKLTSNFVYFTIHVEGESFFLKN
ncbi:MAG: hypothetical protein EBY22_12445 [Gammaproteobacteria bacterium]|nr:hypothetical protein [Gammaproteobacteria bacterium]